MIEKVSDNSFGQSSCDLCDILKGFHPVRISSLYYIRNKNGVFLRLVSGCSMFSNVDEYKKVTLCYQHALECNDFWKARPAYNLVLEVTNEKV